MFGISPYLPQSRKILYKAGRKAGVEMGNNCKQVKTA